MSFVSSFSAFYEPSPYEPVGLTYEYWARKWYEWVQSIKRDDNPVMDSNGSKGSLNQRGRVWFLAGTAGGTANRTSTIPSGRDIFFPIINEMSTKAQYGKSGQELVHYCETVVNKVDNKKVIFDNDILDGINLDPYRVRTSLFSVILPENNLCGVEAGQTEAVCDGYWIMVRKEALSIGNHILYAIGEQTDGFRSEVRYQLTIKD
jgi:hypothetical protein